MASLVFCNKPKKKVVVKVYSNVPTINIMLLLTDVPHLIKIYWNIEVVS